jgi:hypothetical protein
MPPRFAGQFESPRDVGHVGELAGLTAISVNDNGLTSAGAVDEDVEYGTGA